MPRCGQVADTQQLGIGVIEQLGSQREVLHGAVERQEEMSTLLARSCVRARTHMQFSHRTQQQNSVLTAQQPPTTLRGSSAASHTQASPHQWHGARTHSRERE
jgi:hypothetical protein